MKRYLILALLVLFGIGTVEAQVIKKKEMMVNIQMTNVGFNHFALGEDDMPAANFTKINRFGVGAGGGYAVLDDFLVTGQAAIQSFSMDGTSAFLLNIGAGVRKYFADKFFGGATIGLANTSMGETGDKTSTNIIDGTIYAGMALEIFPKLYLEPSFAFGGKLLGGEQQDATAKLKYRQISINLGFAYHF